MTGTEKQEKNLPVFQKGLKSRSARSLVPAPAQGRIRRRWAVKLAYAARTDDIRTAPTQGPTPSAALFRVCAMSRRDVGIAPYRVQRVSIVGDGVLDVPSDGSRARTHSGESADNSFLP